MNVPAQERLVIYLMYQKGYTTGEIMEKYVYHDIHAIFKSLERKGYIKKASPTPVYFINGYGEKKAWYRDTYTLTYRGRKYAERLSRRIDREAEKPI